MGNVLIKPKAAAQEYDTENADEQDKSSTSHLKD